jgi:BASS family bile acid:Na+ symporter
LGRHAASVLALGALVGLAVPPLADLLRPYIVPMIMFSFTLGLIRLDYRAVLRYLRRPALLLVVAAFLLLLVPLVVLAAVQPLGLPIGLAGAVVLMAMAPPPTTAGAFALILGLDAEFAVATTILTHVLVPATLPPLALGLLEVELELSLAAFAGRLALMIGGAFLITLVLRLWFLDWATIERRARAIDGASALGLVTFAIAIMSGVTEVLLARPWEVLLYVAVAFAANLALQVFGALAFWRAGRRLSLTIGHMTGNCNMALILAALADRAPFEIFMFFALAQLPMYMLPALTLPLYRRLMPGGGTR